MATVDTPDEEQEAPGDEPVVWTVPYGRGRVVMTVLGHDLLAMTQPGFLDVLARGTEWAATGNVTPGEPTMAPSTSLVPQSSNH